jgi:polysaccharide export outer membrane protein
MGQRLPSRLLLLGMLLLARLVWSANSGYLLGPGDRISVHLADLKEIEIKPALIEQDGSVELQYAGRLQAAGLTTAELSREVERKLASIIRNPRVTVEVTAYGSQPVSVLGAVNRPGVHQLRGGKTLVEVLSMAEGVKPEAGNIVKITRQKASGPLPLANAKDDRSGQFSVAEISLKSLMEAQRPEENILIRPNDVISIPKAELIYVLGNVRKPGGFPLAERESMTVLQALTLAEGVDATAAPQKSRILRPTGDGPSREIKIDVSKILANRAPDVPLEPNDILVIPNSAAKSLGIRALEAGIQIGTGVVIWRR